MWKVSQAVILYQLTFACYCIISSCFLFVFYSYTIWCIFFTKNHNLQNLMFAAKHFHCSLHNQDVMRHSKSKRSALLARARFLLWEFARLTKIRKYDYYLPLRRKRRRLHESNTLFENCKPRTRDNIRCCNALDMTCSDEGSGGRSG